MIKLLLEHDADVNTKDNNGIRALMGASMADNVDAVRLLLEHGGGC